MSRVSILSLALVVIMVITLFNETLSVQAKTETKYNVPIANTAS